MNQPRMKFAILLGGVFGLLILVGVASVFPNASNQGYDPVQPLPFSHRLHAGDLKIDCKYCHVNADRGRHATIPAMNVCMNCHSQVKKDSPHIQKLTEAYKAGKPIEWIRIHEMPDHVFFNHRPHVAKGVSCQTCHGPVETMDQVYQDQPLNMGQCINCHRGNTAPEEVLRRTYPGVENPHGMAVAPTSCSTCHY